jgi:hypothetical protein
MAFCRKNRIPASRVRRKRDFAYGALTALARKMRGNLEPTTQALILAKSQELDHYYTTRFPRSRTVHHRSVNLDVNSYHAGQAIGSALSINPGIPKSQGPKLLTGR